MEKGLLHAHDGGLHDIMVVIGVLGEDPGLRGHTFAFDHLAFGDLAFGLPIGRGLDDCGSNRAFVGSDIPLMMKWKC
jgi:hypothetical protein